MTYMHGPNGKCFEIACDNLRKHPDWSVWKGFVLVDRWHPHAWNTMKGIVIEPNVPNPHLYYGFEFAVGKKGVERRGVSVDEIKRMDAAMNDTMNRELASRSGSEKK